MKARTVGRLSEALRRRLDVGPDIDPEEGQPAAPKPDEWGSRAEPAAEPEPAAREARVKLDPTDKVLGVVAAGLIVAIGFAGVRHSTLGFGGHDDPFADQCGAHSGRLVDTATDRKCELPNGDTRWRSGYEVGQVWP